MKPPRKTMETNPKPWNHLEKPWKPTKNHENHETTLKNYGNLPCTMKNHETILKNHRNQPKTMKNHETTFKNHRNQPKTIKKNLKLPWKTILKNHGNQPESAHFCYKQTELHHNIYISSSSSISQTPLNRKSPTLWPQQYIILWYMIYNMTYEIIKHIM